MTEGSDTLSIEEITEMDIEEDLLDALRYGVWQSPVDQRTEDVMDRVEEIEVEIEQGAEPKWKVSGLEMSPTVTDISDIRELMERESERAKDRLKGQADPIVVTGSYGPDSWHEDQYDSWKRLERQTYGCDDCYVRRPVFADGEEPKVETKCFGECDGYTVHSRAGIDWDPVKYEFECPECGYETVMWECPEIDEGDIELPECPECPPEPEGPAGIPVVPTESASVEDVPGAVDAKKALDEVTEVAGVSSSKGMAMIEAGYFSKSDLRRATQEEIAEIEGIGNALAARVKADVGDASDTELRVTKVVLEADVDGPPTF